MYRLLMLKMHCRSLLLENMIFISCVIFGEGN